MSSYPARKIRGVLLAKGFQEERSHHIVLRLVVRGKTTGILTKISHGVSDYGDSLLGKMARQIHLSRRELDTFIQCPMSHEDYVGILTEQGDLKAQP